MATVRAVLFDFGHTLFAHAPLAQTVRDAALQLDAAATVDAVAIAARIDAAAMAPEELVHPRDLDSAVWAARWKVLYGMADEDLPGVGAVIDRAMHDPLQWVPYPGTSRVLHALHAAGVRVAIVSNTGWDIRTAVAAHGLADCVDAVIVSYEAGCTKPDPRIFERACDALGVAPADALMVGDDPVADAGAVVAGIRTLLLPRMGPGIDNGLDTVSAVVAAHV